MTSMDSACRAVFHTRAVGFVTGIGIRTGLPGYSAVHARVLPAGRFTNDWSCRERCGNSGVICIIIHFGTRRITGRVARSTRDYGPRPKPKRGEPPTRWLPISTRLFDGFEDMY